MKSINLKSLIILSLFLCVLSNQFVKGDIIIRKDDPGTGTAAPLSLQKATTSTFTLSSSNFIPVTADIIGSELVVNFTATVGTAYVSVVDNAGNLVYQTVVDTFSTSEVAIPINGMSSGKYSLKISYGSTRLTGDFHL